MPARSASQKSPDAACSMLAFAGRIDAMRNARLPTIALVVSTERISAMAARLIATMTISAMNRTTPRWRRDGIEGLAGIAIRVGFMSDRVPELVAHRYHRLV